MRARTRIFCFSRNYAELFGHFFRLLKSWNTVRCGDKKYAFTFSFKFRPKFHKIGHHISSPDSVVTSFKLTNGRVRDQNVNWKSPTSASFVSGQTVTVMTHGWTAEWDSKSFLNDARDAFRSKTSNNFVGVDWSGGSQVVVAGSGHTLTTTWYTLCTQ